MTDQEEDRAGDQQAQVREQDEVLVLLLVQWTLWVEMAHATISVLATHPFALRLLFVVVVACHVREKIGRPATNLLENEQTCCVDGRLFQQLVHLFDQEAHARTVLLTCSWAENHVPLDIS